MMAETTPVLVQLQIVETVVNVVDLLVVALCHQDVNVAVTTLHARMIVVIATMIAVTEGIVPAALMTGLCPSFHVS